ncbi:MAG: THUMP domain-containing protein [Candidatus Bathyarchaeia archaeon]
MGREANLLVTYDPAVFLGARDEVVDLLGEVGVEEPEFLSSRVKGLFMLRVSADPKGVTRRLDALCRAEPHRFWYTYHWIPIETWCSSTLEEMSGVVRGFAERIGPGERWRMTINKRFYRKHRTRELIEGLAELVDRPEVDLENPERIIRVEIIGGRAGLSLLEPVEQFSVNEVKDEVFTTSR